MTSKYFIILHLLFFISIAHGNLNPYIQACMDLCLSCNGIVSFVNDHCECNIANQLNKGAECVIRMKRAAKIRGLSVVSCKNDQRVTRCLVGSKRRFNENNIEYIAKYFMEDGPLTGAILAASSDTDKKSDKNKSAANNDSTKTTPVSEGDSDDKTVVEQSPTDKTSDSKQTDSKPSKSAAPEHEASSSEGDLVGSRQLITQPKETMTDLAKSKNNEDDKADKTSTQKSSTCNDDNSANDCIGASKTKEPEPKSEPEPEPKAKAEPKEAASDSKSDKCEGVVPQVPKPKNSTSDDNSKNDSTVGAPQNNTNADGKMSDSESKEPSSQNDNLPTSSSDSDSADQANNIVELRLTTTTQATTTETENDSKEPSHENSGPDGSSPRQSTCQCDSTPKQSVSDSSEPRNGCGNLSSPSKVTNILNILSEKLGQSVVGRHSQPVADTVHGPANFLNVLIQKFSDIDDEALDYPIQSSPPISIGKSADNSNNNDSTDDVNNTGSINKADHSGNKFSPNSNNDSIVSPKNFANSNLQSSHTNLDDVTQSPKVSTSSSNDKKLNADPPCPCARNPSVGSTNPISASSPSHMQFSSPTIGTPVATHIYFHPMPMVQNPTISRVMPVNGYIPQIPITTYVAGSPLGVPYFQNYNTGIPYMTNSASNNNAGVSINQFNAAKRICKKSIQNFTPIRVIRDIKASLQPTIKKETSSIITNDQVPREIENTVKNFKNVDEKIFKIDETTSLLVEKLNQTIQTRKLIEMEHKIKKEKKNNFDRITKQIIPKSTLAIKPNKEIVKIRGRK